MCQLPLTGPVAAQLFSTLVDADRLLAQLRMSRAAIAQEAAPASGASQPPPIVRRGLTGASVPRILLTLGALCLLAAAITFLAVAWTWLGVGGRTTILVLLTLLALGSSWLLAGRGLRAAGEALCVVGFGLFVLDLTGADAAGWFGDLSAHGLVVLSGLLTGGLALLGAMAARWRARPLTAPQIITALGLVVVPVGLRGLTGAASWPFAAGCLGLLAVAALAQRLQLRALAIAGIVGSAVWWVPLTGSGLQRLSLHPTMRAAWLEGHAWPLLAAAAALVVVAYGARRHRIVAALLGGVAASMVTATLLFPAFDERANLLVPTLCVAVVAWAAATFVLPPAWRPAAILPTAVFALPPLTLAFVQVTQVADTDLMERPWTRSAGHLLPGVTLSGSPWLMPLVALVVCFVAVVWSRRWPGPHWDASAPVPVALLGSLLAYSLIAAVAAYPVPRAALIAALAAVAASQLAWSLWRAGGETLTIGLASASAIGAVVVGAPSAMLTASGFLVVGILAAITAERAADEVGRVLGAILVPPALAGLVASLGQLGEAEESWTAAGILILLGALVVLRPEVPYEASSVVAGTAAAAWGVDRAVPLDHSPYLSFAALYLTIAGVFAVISSLVNPSRRELAWVGGALLAVASWVRLYDLDVRTPEAYTLPSAAVLLVVGVVHLWRHPESSTVRALGAGLGLATVPSLLVVLAHQPITLRALLLGLGCLALVFGGVRLRWQGPLVVGALVGTALVLWEAQPYAAQLPPWVPIAAAGAALIGVGITWERRVKDLHRGAAYVAHLR